MLRLKLSLVVYAAKVGQQMATIRSPSILPLGLLAPHDFNLSIRGFAPPFVIYRLLPMYTACLFLLTVLYSTVL